MRSAAGVFGSSSLMLRMKRRVRRRAMGARLAAGTVGFYAIFQAREAIPYHSSRWELSFDTLDRAEANPHRPRGEAAHRWFFFTHRDGPAYRKPENVAVAQRESARNFVEDFVPAQKPRLTRLPRRTSRYRGKKRR